MIRFGVIGTNFITDKFVEACGKIPDVKINAVYSRNITRAQEYAKMCGAKHSFASLDEMAKCGAIDAIYIASPNSCHNDQSILMLENGKHVLCEKTIASNLKEIQQMEEKAFRSNLVLLEAMRPVFSPGFQAIQKNIWKLGKMRRASFQYCQYSRRYDNFKKGIVENAFNPLLSNGALMDIGVYCIHTVLALFGKPDSVLSSCLKLSNGVDGAGTVLLEYEEMQGEIVYSKITNSNLPSQIQGEEAVMMIDFIPNPRKITIEYYDGNQETLEISTVDNNMIYEIETFVNLIASSNICHAYLKNSEMELAVMDEVRRQQRIVFPADEENTLR